MSEPLTVGEIGVLLDRLINPGRDKQEGFILVRFRHGEYEQPSYAASCDATTACDVLRVLIGTLEGRINNEVGNA